MLPRSGSQVGIQVLLDVSLLHLLIVACATWITACAGITVKLMDFSAKLLREIQLLLQFKVELREATFDNYIKMV